MNVLETSRLNKHFQGIKAVSDISFSIKSGEILACLGANAAGKTTLINLITGWETPDDGQVMINGEPIRHFCPEVFAAYGVVRTFQKARLFQRQTVLGNLLLASRPQTEENLRSALLLRSHWKESEKKELVRAEEILDELGILHLLDKGGDALSGGEQRLVELAAAAMRRPKILVLDEPVANLSQQSRKKVAEFLLKQRESGIACILIEHDLSFVRQIADKVLALAHGAALGLGSVAVSSTWKMVAKSYHLPSTIKADLLAPAGSRSLNDDSATSVLGLSTSADPPENHQMDETKQFNSVSKLIAIAAKFTAFGALKNMARQSNGGVKKGNMDSKRQSVGISQGSLSLKDLSVDYGHGKVVQNINIHIEPGEIVALVGGNGTGKSSIIRAVLGLVPCQGTIKLDGKLLTSFAPHVISHLGISYVSQNKKVFPSLTVLENLLVASEFHPKLQAGQLDYVLHIFPELENWLGLPAGNLSGGQQQLTALARGLLRQPSLLLLDEPSAALSDNLWKRTADTLAELVKQGLSVFIVEHRLSALNDVVTRGYLLEKGEISFHGSLEEILSQQNLRNQFQFTF